MQPRVGQLRVGRLEREPRAGSRMHDRHLTTDVNPEIDSLRSTGMDHFDAQSPAMSAGSVRARSIRRRLMERVADADDSHLTIAADDGDWQPFLDGIRIKVLREQDGMLSYLLRLEPGASLPAHRHPQDEECIVIDGRLQVGTRAEFGPGSYHLAHGGALHAPIRSATGATIFLRGAVPQADQVLD